MEERCLYEYDYAKSELTDEFLEHHGILGMKWGRRNGPPYPLSSTISTGKKLKYSGSLKENIKKKKAYKNRVKTLKKARKARSEAIEKRKEIAKTKEDIIKTRDAQAMLKNLDKFTTKEIQDFNNREAAINALSQHAVNQMKKNMTKTQKFVAFLKENIKKNTKSAGEKLIKSAYDNTLSELAKVSNNKVLKDAFEKKQNEKDKSQDERINNLEEELKKEKTKTKSSNQNKQKKSKTSKKKTAKSNTTKQKSSNNTQNTSNSKEKSSNNQPESSDNKQTYYPMVVNNTRSLAEIEDPRKKKRR